VSFFFVLSGFLITYLLLAETTKTGTVALKKILRTKDSTDMACVLSRNCNCILCCPAFL
jgi:hypothetical protein